MKKSEKIEIRISLAEKEALARLAESEGRSISELVRELAKKYAQLNMPRPAPEISRWHMAGLILCGLGVGVGSTLSVMNKDPLNKDKKRVYSQFMVHGVVDDHGFGFGIKSDGQTAESVTLGDGPGAITIDIAIKNDENDFPVAAISLCKQTEADCVKTAEEDIDMGRGISPSVWQTSTETGEKLFLVLQPVSG